MDSIVPIDDHLKRELLESANSAISCEKEDDLSTPQKGKDSKRKKSVKQIKGKVDSNPKEKSKKKDSKKF